MRRLFLPLVALGLLNIGEYGALALWGVVEPWQQAWHANVEVVDPDVMLLCVASVVTLATTAMGFTMSYSALRDTFAPEVAHVRGLMALALALPCLLVLLGLTLAIVPGWFFVLLFPLVPIGLSLPFFAATTLIGREKETEILPHRDHERSISRL